VSLELLHLKTVIGLLLEDVAEKPARLLRAQELARKAIDEAFKKIAERKL
jgi:hypothetical protein